MYARELSEETEAVEAIKQARSGGRFLSGDKEMLNALRKIAHKTPSVAAAALYMEAGRVMRRSKQEFVPKDLGTLANSGFVEQPVRGGAAVDMPGHVKVGPNDWVVRLHYGGAASEYALAVHEHLSDHSPYSWRVVELTGGQINWNIPGTGPKYLEKPLNEARIGLAERIAQKVRLVFKGGL